MNVWSTSVLVVVLACASASADDLDMVRQRVVQSLIPTDPQAATQVQRVAEKHAQAIGADGTWADIDFKDQARSLWPARNHLERTVLMARAYRAAPDHAMLAKIHAALDYWLARDYRNPNWWQNEIGTPL